MMAFYISGDNGSVLQVWENGEFVIDADSVSEAGDVEVINDFMNSDGWDNADWQEQPFASDFDQAELEAYVGA